MEEEVSYRKTMICCKKKVGKLLEAEANIFQEKNSMKLSNQGGIQPMLPVSAPSPSYDLIKLINSIHFIYPSLYFPSKYFLIHTTCTYILHSHDKNVLTQLVRSHIKIKK
jgi:hypothetical protein